MEKASILNSGKSKPFSTYTLMHFIKYLVSTPIYKNRLIQAWGEFVLIHKVTFLQLKSQLMTEDLFCSGPLLGQNQKLLRAISLLTKSSNQSQAYRTRGFEQGPHGRACVCVLTLSKTTLGA